MNSVNLLLCTLYSALAPGYPPIGLDIISSCRDEIRNEIMYQIPPIHIGMFNEDIDNESYYERNP